MSSSVEIAHALKDLPPDVSAVIALGKQYGIGSNHADILASDDHLSVDSRITVRAVGYSCLYALEQGKELRVLFSGNKQSLFPTAAIDFIGRNFSDIPPRWYAHPDEESITTEDSAVRAPAILRAEGHDSAALETVGFHIPRSVKKFSKVDPSLIKSAIATDLIVAEQSKEDADYIYRWHSSRRIQLEKLKEVAGQLVDFGVISQLLEVIAKHHRSL